jgi:hypothetical protein
MGHAPQIQNPAAFHAALLKGLLASPSADHQLSDFSIFVRAKPSFAS